MSSPFRLRPGGQRKSQDPSDGLPADIRFPPWDTRRKMGPPTCGTTPVTIGQTWGSVTRAAGGIKKLFATFCNRIAKHKTSIITLDPDMTFDLRDNLQGRVDNVKRVRSAANFGSVTDACANQPSQKCKLTMVDRFIAMLWEVYS